MRFFLRFFFAALFAYPAMSIGAGTDTLLTALKTEIGRKDTYDNEKEDRIAHLKKLQRAAHRLDYSKQYDLCVKLYDEYKSYQYDSAYVYVNKLKDISVAMNDMSSAYYSQIKLGFILLSSGMFKETFDSMRKVDPKVLNDSMKVEYYFIMYRCNSDLAKYNNDKYSSPEYMKASNAYIDSAISLTKKVQQSGCIIQV
jgi:hypothetical protein